MLNASPCFSDKHLGKDTRRVSSGCKSHSTALRKVRGVVSKYFFVKKKVGLGWVGLG